MLVRIDDSSQTINMLSVPRDLEVQLPGCLCKLNAAYSIGGPNLLLHTLKTQVFPGLTVNHLIDVNFGGFADLVNAIGCVYTDVDHRYYNNTAQTDYSSIDIQPGYQKLCGAQALEFVRFRHTDSDIVRNARQQDFIRWAKDQYSVGQLLSKEDQLIHIFGQHVQTDHSLHTTHGLLELFDLLINADAHTIKQIAFPAILLQLQRRRPDPVLRDRESVGRGCGLQEVHHPDEGRGRASVVERASPQEAAPLQRDRGLTADATDARNQALDLGQDRLPHLLPEADRRRRPFEWAARLLLGRDRQLR